MLGETLGAGNGRGYPRAGNGETNPNDEYDYEPEYSTHNTSQKVVSERLSQGETKLEGYSVYSRNKDTIINGHQELRGVVKDSVRGTNSIETDGIEIQREGGAHSCVYTQRAQVVTAEPLPRHEKTMKRDTTEFKLET
ncbi:hypothetical protein TSAR_005407 [Trichomalopsis sarcophagae]|uniref:Uncharacterized protein n=1 Tax=Trichomalopsis sarcophagae TaxID=543379 RepID=A0A232ER64_9HYME|nr:hypothetical protein TSAR_005407 [Trichomalopsis sarcophagae]